MAGLPDDHFLFTATKSFHLVDIGSHRTSIILVQMPHQAAFKKELHVIWFVIVRPG
jgi:hypothetical protein